MPPRAGCAGGRAVARVRRVPRGASSAQTASAAAREDAEERREEPSTPGHDSAFPANGLASRKTTHPVRELRQLVRAREFRVFCHCRPGAG